MKDPDSKMKMLFSILLSFYFFSTAISCPENCFCEEFRAECYIQECTDQLFTEVDLLVIHGQLCQNHKYVLTHIQSETMIILKDTVCGEIPNCR